MQWWQILLIIALAPAGIVAGFLMLAGLVAAFASFFDRWHG